LIYDFKFRYPAMLILPDAESRSRGKAGEPPDMRHLQDHASLSFRAHQRDHSLL
jgi:hypothetical protein